jgi:hypothetical protein
MAKDMTSEDKLSRAARSGTILVLVLIGLLIVSLVSAAMTRAGVRQHRQSRRSELRLQALWLADSAVQRAQHALGQSPDYQGETWRVPAEVLGAEHAGEAFIEVRPVAEPAPGRRIRVQAVYPADSVHRISLERELFVRSEPSTETTLED